MKGLSTLLSLLLAVPVFAQAPSGTYDQAASTNPVYTHPPVTVLAPRPPSEDDASTKRLKTARGIGGVTTLSGFGLLGYVIATGATGPLGFAVGMICLGAIAAYEAHKGLQSKKRFEREGEAAP
jgi:hypothetical protein